MALVFPLRRGAIIYQVINNTVGVCVSSTCCCVFFCFYFHAVHTNRYTHLRAQQTTAEKICFKSPHVAAGFVRPCTHSQLTNTYYSNRHRDGVESSHPRVFYSRPVPLPLARVSYFLCGPLTPLYPLSTLISPPHLHSATRGLARHHLRRVLGDTRPRTHRRRSRRGCFTTPFESSAGREAVGSPHRQAAGRRGNGSWYSLPSLPFVWKHPP